VSVATTVKHSAGGQFVAHAAALGRNHLAHASGDAINAVLAAAGYNFRRLLAWLKLLLLRILIALGLAAQLKIALKPSSSQTTTFRCTLQPWRSAPFSCPSCGARVD
jgi:hypothetical protein